MVRNHNSSKMAGRIKCNTANHVPIVVPGRQALQAQLHYIPNIIIAGSRSPTIPHQQEVRKTHFPKYRNCDICLRTKITRDPCSKRTGTVVPRPEHFGDLITADHKVLSEGVNLETITDTQSRYKTRGKRKLHRKRKRVCKSCWIR